jgi:hypothetical protein
LRFVYFGEIKNCDWPLFLPMQRGADLARLIPRVKRAQSDWQATVTLGCPRCHCSSLLDTRLMAKQPG